MMYGKLVDGELIEIPFFKEIEENGIRKQIMKTNEELEAEGARIVKEEPAINVGVYQKTQIRYEELGTKIIIHNDIIDKTEEEIIALNEEWFNNNYFMVQTLLPKELYIPYKNYSDGVEHDLFKDDYAVMLLGAQTGQLTHLELFTKPDMKLPINKEKMAANKVIVDIPSEMGAVIGFIAAMSFKQREVPTVE